MREVLMSADFKPYLNQTFQVHMNDRALIEIELAEMEDHSTDFLENFSLFFRGPKDNLFFQNTYRMTHPAIGEFMLFLGPVDIKKMDGVYYQAVFNRFHNNLKQKEV
jgi:hypothetical protein